MTVLYKGRSKGFNYRLAEVFFTDDEWELACRMEKPLRIKGWDFEVVTDGYAGATVADFDEYKQFVKDYIEVKKAVKLWSKFGF